MPMRPVLGRLYMASHIRRSQSLRRQGLVLIRGFHKSTVPSSRSTSAVRVGRWLLQVTAQGPPGGGVLKNRPESREAQAVRELQTYMEGVGTATSFRTVVSKHLGLREHQGCYSQDFYLATDPYQNRERSCRLTVQHDSKPRDVEKKHQKRKYLPFVLQQPPAIYNGPACAYPVPCL